MTASAAFTGALRSSGRAVAKPASDGRFQFVCVTYNLPKNMDLETVSQTLEATGIAAVESHTGHKHGVEPSIGAGARARAVRTFEFVDLAKDTGALVVKVRPNGLPESVDYATAIKNIVGGLHIVASSRRASLATTAEFSMSCMLGANDRINPVVIGAD